MAKESMVKFENTGDRVAGVVPTRLEIHRGYRLDITLENMGRTDQASMVESAEVRFITRSSYTDVFGITLEQLRQLRDLLNEVDLEEEND